MRSRQQNGIERRNRFLFRNRNAVSAPFRNEPERPGTESVPRPRRTQHRDIEGISLFSFCIERKHICFSCLNDAPFVFIHTNAPHLHGMMRSESPFSLYPQRFRFRQIPWDPFLYTGFKIGISVQPVGREKCALRNGGFLRRIVFCPGKRINGDGTFFPMFAETHQSNADFFPGIKFLICSADGSILSYIAEFGKRDRNPCPAAD